jgi:hypothetical protein
MTNLLEQAIIRRRISSIAVCQGGTDPATKPPLALGLAARPMSLGWVFFSPGTGLKRPINAAAYGHDRDSRDAQVGDVSATGTGAPARDCCVRLPMMRRPVAI